MNGKYNSECIEDTQNENKVQTSNATDFFDFEL